MSECDDYNIIWEGEKDGMAREANEWAKNESDVTPVLRQCFLVEPPVVEDE